MWQAISNLRENKKISQFTFYTLEGTCWYQLLLVGLYISFFGGCLDTGTALFMLGAAIVGVGTLALLIKEGLLGLPHGAGAGAGSPENITLPAPVETARSVFDSLWVDFALCFLILLFLFVSLAHYLTRRV